mgnify:CR=1 FL=1
MSKQMDLSTLQALGITPEELTQRIVDQAVEALLTSTGYDADNDMEATYESRFKRDIAAKVQKAVDAKISALAEEHLIPKVPATIIVVAVSVALVSTLSLEDRGVEVVGDKYQTSM